MGLRYRKSISFLGGTFRINFSKSGIGYSYGGKGARVTKMANGRKRVTLSIPGTGISYVSESGKKRTKQNNSYGMTGKQSDDIYLKSIKSKSVEDIVSLDEKDFIHALRSNRICFSLLKWINVLLLIALFAVAIKQNGRVYEFSIFDVLMYSWLLVVLLSIGFFLFGKIKLTYDIDDYGMKKFQQVNSAIKILKQNQKVWQVNDIYLNTRGRTNAGVTSSVVMKPIKIKRKNPRFLKMNVKCYVLILKKRKIILIA